MNRFQILKGEKLKPSVIKQDLDPKQVLIEIENREYKAKLLDLSVASSVHGVNKTIELLIGMDVVPLSYDWRMKSRDGLISVRFPCRTDPPMPVYIQDVNSYDDPDDGTRWVHLTGLIHENEI